MEHLPNGITFSTGKGAFPLSTDSMVLSHFVRLPKKVRVLDLGSGSGSLGLLLCSRDQGCTVTGLEISEKAHAAAVENICRNGLQHRMMSICTDLRRVSQEFSPGSFSVCVSNPPYFSGGPASKTLTAARREDCCTCQDLFQAAAHALKFGGDLFLVHRPERLAELIAAAAQQNLEAKRLCLVRHRPGAPASLILLQFRKGGKPGLLWEEQTLFQADGAPTPYYREVYHLDQNAAGVEFTLPEKTKAFREASTSN